MVNYLKSLDAINISVITVQKFVVLAKMLLVLIFCCVSCVTCTFVSIWKYNMYVSKRCIYEIWYLPRLGLYLLPDQLHIHQQCLLELYNHHNDVNLIFYIFSNNLISVKFLACPPPPKEFVPYPLFEPIALPPLTKLPKLETLPQPPQALLPTIYSQPCSF